MYMDAGKERREGARQDVYSGTTLEIAIEMENDNENENEHEHEH